MARMEKSCPEELNNTYSAQGDYEIVCVNPFDDEFDDTESISPSKCIKPVKGKPFECTICNQRFAQKKTLQQHVLTHTGDRPYQCTICLKSFTQVGSMERHMKLHINEEKPFACHICQLTFRQLTNLKRHLIVHEGNAPGHQCDICYRRFARKDGLLRHAITHESKRKKIHCQFCGKTFTNKNSLPIHVRMHHDGLVSKTLTCHKCNVDISDESFLIPDTNDEFICTRCKNTNYEARDTTTLSQLEKHARRNDYVRVYQCNDCDQLFTNRSRFIRHVRKHNIVTPIVIVEIVD